MKSIALFAVVCLILLMAAIVTLPVYSQTGGIKGMVRTSGGQLCGEDEVRAQMQGSSTTSQEYDYGRIYWDGIFQIPEAGQDHNNRTPNLYPGTYAVGMSDEYEWRPRNYSYVKVQNGALTTCNINVPETYGVRNQNGTTPTYNSIGQTFVAKGGSLQRLTLWLVSAACTITVRQGGPGGAIVGSPKDIPWKSPTVTWRYGEIPTVAGQTYYVEFSTPSGFSTYRNSNNPYPSGTAYYNGTAQSGTDLMMTLFEDCDGQASMYHVHLAGNGTSNFYAYCGQTFKARGSNILSVSLRFRTGGGTKTAICSIHSGGPTGAQIGPSKATTVHDYNPVGQKVTFCWLPGEVPVTNGATYYLKVVTPDIEGLYVWCTSNDVYPDGQAYEWSSPHGGDLVGTIMGEVSNGSSTCTIWGKVRDSAGNPVQSATVSLNNCGYSTLTNASGDYSIKVTGDTYDLTCQKTSYATQYVNGYNAQCGTIKELNWTLPMPGYISGFVKDTNGTAISGASVTTSTGGYTATSSANGFFYMPGVLPGAYDVTASRLGYIQQTKAGIAVNPGANTSCSFDLSPKTSLENPGFESTDANKNPLGWTKYGHGLSVRTGTGYCGITAYNGTCYAENGASWTDPKTGGIYQSVWAPVYVPLIADAWVMCYGEGGGAAHTLARIGIDPTGGTNPVSAAIQWSPWYNAPADNIKQWVQLSKTAIPTGNIVTVFLDYVEQPNGAYAYPWQVNGFDLVSLSSPELISVLAAKQQPNDSVVYVGPAVITAKFGGTPGSFYVEDSARISGMRINGTTSYDIGDVVKVYGSMKSTNGERYLEASSVQTN